MKMIDRPYFRVLILTMLSLSLCFCRRTAERHPITDPPVLHASDIITPRNVPNGHKAFIARFLPAIQKANNDILRQRNRILDIRDSIGDATHIPAAMARELNAYLRQYRLEVIDTSAVLAPSFPDSTFSRLLRRVDIIPARLAMAQAIIESGWGSSKFAREANNYYGIRCYREGCGMSPTGADSAGFYVKSYPSEAACIRDYLWNLNTGYAYRDLRSSRAAMREKKKPLDPVELAAGLTSYSSRGEEYTEMVNNIIKEYLPENTGELLKGKKQ